MAKNNGDPRANSKKMNSTSNPFLKLGTWNRNISHLADQTRQAQFPKMYKTMNIDNKVDAREILKYTMNMTDPK